MQVCLQEVTSRITEKSAILYVLVLDSGGHKCRRPAFGDLAPIAAGDGRPACGLSGRGELVGVEGENWSATLASQRAQFVEVDLGRRSQRRPWVLAQYGDERPEGFALSR